LDLKNQMSDMDQNETRHCTMLLNYIYNLVIGHEVPLSELNFTKIV